MALVLSLGAGTAMALRSLSITGEQTTTLNGTLTFVEQGRITCNITMTKRFNRAIPKRAFAVLGQVTRVTVERCTTMSEMFIINSMRFLGLGIERLWQLLYNGFLGTLPEITGFLYYINRMQILTEVTNMMVPGRCLYENPRENSIPMLASLDGAQEIRELESLNLLAAQLEFPLLRELPGSLRCERQARVELRLRPTTATRVVLI
ncbi:MAG TPA: hypothetical protein VE972_10375 [Conexibacter sp.]|nr:hypothetical protein [Conexibacter sp.]